MNFEVSIVDNNLLRRISKIGNYALYSKYYQKIRDDGYLTQSTKLIVTPYGILEFLGLSIPPLSISADSIYEEAKRLSHVSPFDFTKFSKLRGRVIKLYENELRSLNLYSKSRFSKLIGEQKKYTEPILADWLFNFIKENVFNNDNRSVIYNRVALDKSYTYVWPIEISSEVHTVYMADLGDSIELKVSIGSMRGISRLWKGYTLTVENHLREGRDLGKLEKSYLLQNLQKSRDAVDFKNEGDFLDVSAIHELCIGRYEGGVLKPILFCTEDPAGKLITRISIFKSIYINAMEMTHKEDTSWKTVAQEGICLVFDEQVNLQYKIPISEVEPLIYKIGDEKYDDWLNNQMNKFKV